MMVIPGLVPGLVGSLASARVMSRLFEDVAPADPTTVVAATVCLMVVALAASVGPAWRASRIDPVQALRGE
jgi:ABC-type lipoprotein release transport system permease subunit